MRERLYGDVAFQKPLGPTSRREFLQLARMAIAKGQPGA